MFGRARRFIEILIIGTQTVLLAWGAYRQSPTYNEVAHVAAGISYWQLGRFDIYRVNPPLTRLVAAAPVLVASPTTDWRSFYESVGGRPEWQIGRDFVAANGERSLRLYRIGRWACIPFSWLGAWICCRWAGELYGRKAGLCALVLWCFCPNVIAHAQLVTPDIGAAALGIAASYCFWRWLKSPRWRWALICGGVLGLAELTKFTFLILFALWPILWIVWRCGFKTPRSDIQSWVLHALQLGLMFAIAIYVINLCYGFEGSCQQLRTFHFVSDAMTRRSQVHTFREDNRFAETWLGSLPIPLPRNYVIGIDLQEKDLEHFSPPAYLHGSFRDKGWWYYYLYAAAIKVPIGTWILALISLATPFSRSNQRSSWRDTLIIVVPMLVIIAAVSSQTGLNHHFRYALPAFPFAFIWIGRVATFCKSDRLSVKLFAAGAVTWSVVSSLWIYPHNLSYFNEVVGGPNGGSAHLLDSNIDWGQDLLFLRDWLVAHQEAEPLNLAYFGNFDPRDVGIKFQVPNTLNPERRSENSNRRLEPGWYAISVNFLRGAPGPLPAGDGNWAFAPPHAFSQLENTRPDGQAGYSIAIIKVARDRND